MLMALTRNSVEVLTSRKVYWILQTAPFCVLCTNLAAGVGFNAYTYLKHLTKLIYIFITFDET